LNKPQVDLFASEEAKKRQEMLESQAAATQDKPLSFGQKDGQALEETQLEHVMQGRSERLSTLGTPPGSNPVSARMSVTKQNGKTPTSMPWGSESGVDSPLRVWTPNEDLSVERYGHLAGDGLEMYGRHISEFQSIMTEGKVKLTSPSNRSLA
jgi:hypothetical protein